MRAALRRLAAAGLFAAAAPAGADSAQQVWPELNYYDRFDERYRMFLSASSTRAETDGARNQDYALGAYLDIFLRTYFWMRFGVQHSAGLGDDDSSENRLLADFNAPLTVAPGLRIIPRLRLEHRWIDGDESNRYRVRLAVEKDISLDRRGWMFYADAEDYYDDRYDAWTRQRYRAGAEVALTGAWRVEAYYAYQRDSRSSTSPIDAHRPGAQVLPLPLMALWQKLWLLFAVIWVVVAGLNVGDHRGFFRRGNRAAEGSRAPCPGGSGSRRYLFAAMGVGTLAAREAITFSSLRASASNLRMPSASLSVAIASSLCCQRKAFSSRWIFSHRQAFRFFRGKLSFDITFDASKASPANRERSSAGRSPPARGSARSS